MLPLIFAIAAQAELVHVYQEQLVGGVRTQLSDEAKETGETYTTQTAPAQSGYIFTHWSISTAQVFTNRDRLGRALDAAPYKLYEETTLTANYLPSGEDMDNDGVADGWEIYWYGDLSKNADSDTDGDGYTFAQELAGGTDPLMVDESLAGGIVWADGDLLQYNPFNLQAYTIRSEPEGQLFATRSDYVEPGTLVETSSYSPSSSTFAYWTVNGIRQADRLGRAKDSISVAMPSNSLEIVAMCEDDANTRMGLYWYGTETSMESDTDGDSYTFAQELAAGTDPLMADQSLAGGIVWADGDLLQYNPYNLQAYTIRSEPEGQLFATRSDYVEPGTIVQAGTQGTEVTKETGFAYWMVDGVRQADRLGRAKDTLSIAMPSNAIEVVAVFESDVSRREALYWYGDASVSMESDTDGDGYTFAQELAGGTDPLMADESLAGGIVWADGELLETNLQPYEQVQGTVVGDEYSELFTSPVAGNGGTSRTFDGAATPTVVDLNGDGRFDLVVETAKGGRTVFLNEGGAGNPHFVETAWNPNWLKPLNNAKTNTIDGLSFDVQPLNAVSWSFADVDKDGIVDLLVADVDGRIWYYRGVVDDGGAQGTVRYALQHKVWGGSYPGFANGLQIAAVDWDDDGDVDLVCGTSEGKLMLLNDPRVGRPVNLRAEAGATSVVLMWDPNVNSRVRGYGIYRSADSNEFAKIENMCPLPRYRDVPPTIQDWFYRVTGKSRLYVTGNSTPVESESIPTDAIYVQMRPSVWLTDTSSFTDTNVEVVVSMNNSMGISADGFSMTFTYDSNVLQPVEIKKSGLTADLNLVGRDDPIALQGGRAWVVSATGGEIGIGAGEFLWLVFYVKPVHDVTETTVSLASATVKSEAGQAVSLELPKSAKIDISDANPLQPAVVSIQAGNAAAATGEEFDLPFTITSTEVLTSGVFTVSFDEAMLELRGVNGGELRRDGDIALYQVAATESGSLRFAVKEQHSVATNFSTTVSLSEAQFVDCNGFEVTADDSQGTVLIKNSHPILPAVVSVSTEDRKVDTLETVVVPFKVMSNEALASGSFTVTWDPTVLEFSGTSGTSGTAGAGGSLTVSSTGDFSITFLAKDQHDSSKTLVSLTSATVTDVNGFAVTPAVPVVSTVLIHDAHPLIPAVVSMSLGDVAVETESEFDMTLSITSTETLTALRMNLAYDTSLLELRSGVLEYSGTVPSSVTLRFYAKENHTVGKAAVTITPVSAKDKNGFTNEITLPTSVVGNVILADSNPWQPATVSVGVAGAKVDTRSEFAIPVTITSNETLTNFVTTVTWNENALEFRGVTGAAVAGLPPYQSGNVRITGEGGNFSLNFYAKDQHEYASAEVGLSAMSAMDNHGLAANAIADATATVVIHDAFPLMPAVVSMSIGDVAVETESEFDMTLSITSTETLTALRMNLAYDTSLLELRSGVLEYNGTVPSSVTLRFYAKGNHTVDKTAVMITPVSATDKNGFTTEITLPASVVGNVILADSNPWQPATVSVGIAGAKVDTRSEFAIPVTITSNETLTNFAATVTWDENALEFRGVTGAAIARQPPYQSGNVQVTCEDGNFTLNFYAKDQHESASAEVGLSSMSAIDNHGLVANAIADASSTVVIHDAYPLVPADVAIKAGTVSAKTRNAFEVPITITSSKVLTGMSVTVSWDEGVLELKGVGGMACAERPPYRIVADGDVPSVITLTFYAKDQHTVKETAISLSDGAAVCTDGLDANVTTENGKVLLTDSNPPVAVNMAIATLDARAESGKPFVVPLGATTDGNLAELTATVEWDANMLTFNGADGATVVSSSVVSATLTFPASGTHNLFDLGFTAKSITDLRANTTVRVMSAGGTGANGLAAKLTTTLPVESTVLIVRNINKYDPGDIDGDGKYTDADMTLLKNYIKYLSIVSAAPQLAGRYASWKLTGMALKAADANSDGKVDVNDVSMLAQFIASWKEANK